jgi:hypothetical protein
VQLYAKKFGPTWLHHSDSFRDILHEYATLELQFRLAILGKRLSLILLLFRVDFLATKKDQLKKIDLVLGEGQYSSV